MRAMRAMVWVMAMAIVAAVVFGCAEQRPERSYVQSGAVSKSIFSGQWYYKMTVIDHPYEAKFTFIGEEGYQLEKIRWVIDENFLYAYRAYENILQTEAGKCAQAGTTTIDTARAYCYQDNECNPGQICLKDSVKYYGSPIAAYRVLSHFDIQRQYNPTTGEEINVLEENSRDRMWWQREYFRVDWSQNQIYDFFHFIKEYSDPMYGNMKKEPVAYYDQQNKIVTPDYIDIVNQEIVSATGNSLMYESSYPVILNSIPITFRHAFLKVVPNDYQAMNFPDPMFEHFGYFRLDREGFDKNWGLNEITRNYNISRWNIFKKWKNEDGTPIPTKDREIRKIVYYLNKDFPANLRDTANLLVREWDIAYRETLAGMLETEGMARAEAMAWVESKIDKAANNGWGAIVFQLRDNDECDDTWQAGVVDASGNKVLRDAAKCGKNPGDLRYNYIYWIARPMAGGPLGYGPSNADPETGEIINATANIYGSALETYKAMSMEFYDVIKGQSVDNTDITEMIAKGEDMRSYFQTQYGGVQPMGPQGGPFKPAENAKASIDQILQKVKAFAPDQENGHRLLQDRALMTANHAQSRLLAEKMPQFEQMLLGKDVMVTKGFDVSGWDNGAKLTPDQLDAYSPLRQDAAKAETANFHKAEYLKSRYRCILEPNEMTDWGVWKLVQKYAVEKGYSRDQVANLVENGVFRGVTAHEVGHTLGLRHQFESSADANNFHDEYWQIYGEVMGLTAEQIAAEVAAGTPFDQASTAQCQGVTGFAGFDLMHAPENLTDSASYDSYLKTWGCFRTLMKRRGAEYYQQSTLMDYGDTFYSDGFSGTPVTEPWNAPKSDLWATQYPMAIGKYDRAAIKYGYGLVVEKWDEGNSAYDKSKRKNYKYYYGGEDCRTAACPYAANGQTCMTGVCRPLRIQGQQVWDGGERCSRDQECMGFKDGQRCETDPTYPPVCSEFYQNFDYSKEVNDAGNPIKYAMCSDERTDDQPFCNRWDSGATSQEIVANMIELYNRGYVFNNFRRYRRNFGFSYDSRIFGRYFTTIGKQYQAMLYNYYYKPGMRAPSSYFRPGGLIDMYLASAQGLNFFNSVIGAPDIGSYIKNDGQKTYQRIDPDPNNTQQTCGVHWGEGKYYWHRYEPGFYGQIYRLAIIGTVVDKIMALDAISTRDWNFPPTSGMRFYINYYDFFKNEVLDLFTGALSSDVSKYGMLVDTDPATGHCVMTPRNIWYGGVGLFSSPIVQRDPNAEYVGKYTMESSASFYSQYYAFAYAQDRFPVFFDSNFQRKYMWLWIQGDLGTGYNPTDPSLVCEYTSPFTPKYIWRSMRAMDTVSTGSGTKNVDRSMTCAMVDRANYFKNCYEKECAGIDQTSAMYELQSMESFMNIVRGAFVSGL